VEDNPSGKKKPQKRQCVENPQQSENFSKEKEKNRPVGECWKKKEEKRQVNQIWVDEPLKGNPPSLFN